MTESARLDPTALDRIDRSWRAANYLSVGQIYLLDNPLLREPLRAVHVKPRLMGHCRTTPGLNCISATHGWALPRSGRAYARPRVGDAGRFGAFK